MDWTGLDYFLDDFLDYFFGRFFGTFYREGGTPLVLRLGWVQSTSTEGGVEEECYY